MSSSSWQLIERVTRWLGPGVVRRVTGLRKGESLSKSLGRMYFRWGVLALLAAAALMWATVHWDWGLFSGGGIMSALFVFIAGSLFRYSRDEFRNDD